jgi:hypothetical protein
MSDQAFMLESSHHLIKDTANRTSNAFQMIFCTSLFNICGLANECIFLRFVTNGIAALVYHRLCGLQKIAIRRVVQVTRRTHHTISLRVSGILI